MSEAVIAQNVPYGVEVNEGEEYWWCACGRSKSQPFCDGSHKDTGLSPVQYVAKSDRMVYFCGCKQSLIAPICDGTHSAL